jgi:hypothetical protein
MTNRYQPQKYLPFSHNRRSHGRNEKDQIIGSSTTRAYDYTGRDGEQENRSFLFKARRDKDISSRTRYVDY